MMRKFLQIHVVLFSLLACRTEKTVVSEPSVEIVDQDVDGDGYVSSIDCDDYDPTVHPYSNEICDGIDNDCNGEVDEGVNTLYYADTDGDGFGDNESTRYACEVPSGFIIVGNDCDDTNNRTFPGATELCDEIDNDCDGDIDEGLLEGVFFDGDNDGFGDPSIPAEDCSVDLQKFVHNALDCDDSNPQIYNGAQEICDDLDNDCDGAVDEPGSGTELWFLDFDGDGYGDALETTYACTQPSGYVDNLLDCDDTDAMQYPGAEEYCNSEDDNCNGFIDDNPVDPIAYYFDADSDGYGTALIFIRDCTQPVGYVSNDADCDDNSQIISPIAPELCNGQDDNCNNIVDENAIGSTTYYADTDGDGYGDANTSVHSCQTVSGYVVNALDCNDSDSAQNPMGVEMCNGADDDCNGIIDEYAVDALLWYADADGDGFGIVNDWTFGCSQPTGYVSIFGDCDDGNAQKNPNTLEICNGLDDNCNYQIDENTEVFAWYYDIDNDGYGDPFSMVEACSAPVGLISNNEDCDDGNPDINPSEDEWCADNIDNNCDGLVDDDTSVDAFSGYVDLDGDGFAGDFFDSSCDDIYFVSSTDCDDDDSSVKPSATEVCDGIDNDCNGVIDSAGLCPCNFQQYNGSSYLFCTANRTWSVAKGECAQYGYYLVTIDNATENAWIDATLRAYSNSMTWWMGYNDLTVEGYWDWDGPFATYTNWGNGEPNNYNGNEDCGMLNAFGNPLWNDANCSTSTYFICEANP